MGERHTRHGAGARVQALGSALIGCLLIGGLGACGSGGVFSDDGSPDEGGYPSLHSVPAQARPSSSIEERRRIVRTLLDERDESRQATTIVRRRNGLSVDLTPVPAGDGVRAEDIVPDAFGGDGDFRLTPADNDTAGTVYRSDSQFDDGGLDDFIRQLKRDTQTDAPEPSPTEAEEPASDESDEDDVSLVFPDSREIKFGRKEGVEQPILLAGFVPVFAKAPLAERDVMIRLAAAEEESGFFCRYLGWSVAWSSMCVEDTATEPLANSDEDVGADLEQELRQSQEDDSPGSSAGSGSSSSSEAGRERADRRLSEEDAEEAIEDAGRSVLAPVTSSLEKLRDYMESRRERSTDTSSPARASPNRTEATSSRTAPSRTTLTERPPIPESRPRRRDDIAIEDKGETFDFIRTPRPAFKPTPDEPVTLQARSERLRELKPVKRFDPPPLPLSRPGDLSPGPGDLLSDLKGAGVMAESQEVGDKLQKRSASPGLTSDIDQNEEPAAISDVVAAIPSGVDYEAGVKAPVSKPQIPAPSAGRTPNPNPAARSPEPALETAAEQVAMVITFEPEKPGLPRGLWPELAAVLEDARARDRKIHIIGEASSHHLARRRATDVGAALVQLGATVEILEYDHDAITGVDQVRLVLQPALPDPLAKVEQPAAIQE